MRKNVSTDAKTQVPMQFLRFYKKSMLKDYNCQLHFGCYLRSKQVFYYYISTLKNIIAEIEVSVCGRVIAL